MKNKKGIMILFVLFILLVASSMYMIKVITPVEVIVSEVDTDRTSNSESKLLTQLDSADDIYTNLIDTDFNNIDVESLSKYQIDVIFNEEDMTLDVSQSIDYTNTEDVSLSELQFHVFTNAFKKEETSPTTLSSMSYAYPNGFSEGYTEFEYIMLDGKEVAYELSGLDNSKLLVKLNENLESDSKAIIEMKYKIQIPNCRDRFGYDERTVQIANWYPVLAVFEDGKWNENPYYGIGDPFYTETSIYDVNLDVPSSFIAASSGIKEDIIMKNEDRKIYKISSDFTRDFAIVMSKYFKIESKIVDGTRISTYTYTEDTDNINNALESAEKTLISFNDMFGKYPYTDLAIVETSFPSGMEYPGLVMIGNSYYIKGYEVSLDEVVNHEIGHQWWYSIVGNDQIKESWLDEGLTSYSEILYKEYYDKNEYDYEVRKLKKRVASGNKRYKNLVVAKPLEEFEDWGDYGFLAYRKAQIFFVKYREIYGEEKLNEALKLHFEKNKFKVTSTLDIIETFESVAGEDISELKNEVLYHVKQ